MKLLIIAIFFSTSAFAAGSRAWYISAAGSNSNSGLSAATAWADINKLNASWGSIAAGDSILFSAGDVFIGSVIVGKDNIFFGSFGVGNKPVLTGFQTLTGWTNSGGGIWKINVPAATSRMMEMAINGKAQRKGRYPNYDAANGGYLSYEGVNYSAYAITDNQLTTATNWTGAQAVIRTFAYILDVVDITGHSGGTLTFAQPESNNHGEPGFGYFIQNDIRTLDQFGEWYLNPSTKDLSVFFGANNPASYNIKASVVDTVINCGDGGFYYTGRIGRTGIKVNNLQLEGANDMAFYSQNGNNNVITNCTLDNNFNGIYIWHSAYNTINNNTITNTLNNAINVLPGNSSPTLTTINNNTIRNCGLYAGMGESGGGARAVGKGVYSAIIQEGNNTTIENNRVDSIGFNGIKFGTNPGVTPRGNVSVRYNYVTNFNSVLDDGGGIYVYQSAAQDKNIVQYNIVKGGIGALLGRTGGQGTNGIYIDNDCINIDVIDNTVSDISSTGIFTNTPNYLTISRNNIFNTPVGIQVQRYEGTTANPSAYVRNNTITNNTIYATTCNFQYAQGQLKEPTNYTIQQDMRLIGRIDSNYILNNLSQPFSYYWKDSVDNYSVVPARTFPTNYVSSLNLSAWRTHMNQEANTKIIPTTPTPTLITNPTSSVLNYSFPGVSNSTLDGTVYNEVAPVQPYGSALLFYSGSYAAPPVVVPPPVLGARSFLTVKLKRYKNPG